MPPRRAGPLLPGDSDALSYVEVSRSKRRIFGAGFWREEADYFIKTDSLSMKKVINAAKSVALTNSTVLLTGETGTGKNVLAELIHRHSNRKENPFISVHCGAIPENLIESDLFGHERGAFTGAVSGKMGKFELAKRGTIFLDEVGTMTTSSQTRLLKVLQEKVFQRVGGVKDIHADVRVIAAANRDLLKLCRNGDFRWDLYYRLNVFPMEIPPLRGRIDLTARNAGVSSRYIHKLMHKYGLKKELFNT